MFMLKDMAVFNIIGEEKPCLDFREVLVRFSIKTQTSNGRHPKLFLWNFAELHFTRYNETLKDVVLSGPTR